MGVKEPRLTARPNGPGCHVGTLIASFHLVRLVLFDIDGTLLSASGAGRRAIHTALRDVFGTTGPDNYWFDGKTDRQIVRDLMRSVGHSDDTIDERMAAVEERYLECLHRELKDPAHPTHLYPGVGELLDVLEARDDVTLGLVTGNLEEGARAKLRASGLEPARFVVGAFGSDHETRSELPAIAQRRARDTLGVDIDGTAVVVIGDTPADIACGRGIGARAIGVATGRYSAAELEAHSPSAVFDNFGPTDRVVAAIMGAPLGESPGDARGAEAGRQGGSRRARS
jgi:phosphoglycolate phosphatase